MIVLNKNIKVEILELFDSLSSNREESETFLHFLESRLTGDLDNRLFLELEYLVFYTNSHKYSTLVFKVFHTIYRKIATLNTDIQNNQFLDRLYLEFYEQVFLSKCIEMTRRLNTNTTIYRVLKHLSQHQEQTLNTNQLMIANISHDMRTALAAIEGYGNIINDDNTLSSSTYEYLTKMQQSTKTLSSLVEDILSISKFNSDQMEIEINPFWVDEIILQAINDLTQKAKDKGLEISYNIPMLSSQFYGDRHRIYEVVVNLISNAIKYTLKGFVKITLNVTNEDSDYPIFNFEVEDSGLGISKDEADTIFDPYKRHNNIENGVGLGLYISNQLAHKMDGKIELKSHVGVGSVFTFSLKLRKSSSEEKPLDGLIIYLLNNNNNNIYNRINTLKELGATVSYYKDSEKFSNKIFSKRKVNTNKVDMVIIIIDEKNYKEYDELIGYIKHFEQYSSTSFIVEGVANKKDTHFDTVNCYEIPLSYYIDKVSKKRKNRIVKSSSECSIRILAVDDMATNLELLKLFIKKEYPKVKLDLVLGAKEALEYYENKEYDLLFLDLKMPEIDGFMLYKKLNDVRKLPVTYALTADAYKETHERVNKTGFSGIITKPINIEKLYKIIREVDIDK